MAEDRRLSVRMIAEETGLDKSAVHRILTDHLHMRKICAKLVPKNLSVEQKANRLEIVRICWEDSKLSQIFRIK